MANLDDVIKEHADKFEGSNAKANYDALHTKLNELGYDVLINHKEKAEFIPSNRLSEVVSQRDGFKGKVEELNTQLEALKVSSKGNDQLQAQLQSMVDKNNTLLQDLEQTKINSEIIAFAKDAINAKDLLAFIDFTNIKLNSKGEVLGVESEMKRLKEAKPYLFEDGKKSNKGGTDSGSTGGANGGSMNDAIRRIAGRT